MAIDPTSGSGTALALSMAHPMDVRRAELWARAGLGAEALVETRAGLRALILITPGDELRTANGGWARVEAVLRHPASGFEPAVRISAGALGPGLPMADVIVAPGQHLCLTHDAAAWLVGCDRPLVRAQDLLPLAGVARVDLQGSGLVELVFDSYALPLVAGVGCEGFLPAGNGPLPEEAVAAVPRLRYASAHAGYRRDLPVLDQRELSALFAERWTDEAAQDKVQVIDFTARARNPWTDPGMSGPSAPSLASSGVSTPRTTC